MCLRTTVSLQIHPRLSNVGTLTFPRAGCQPSSLNCRCMCHTSHLDAITMAKCILVHTMLMNHLLPKPAGSRSETPVQSHLGCRAAMPPGGSRGVPVTKRRKRRWSAASNSVRICGKGCSMYEAVAHGRRSQQQGLHKHMYLTKAAWCAALQPTLSAAAWTTTRCTSTGACHAAGS